MAVTSAQIVDPRADHEVPALDVRGVQRVYAGTAALAGADLLVRPGEVHGLLGENGAGKSTLVRIVAGLEAPDAGTVAIFGEDVTETLSPEVAAARGCAFIHQALALVDDLSVCENVALVSGFTRGRSGLIDWRATRHKAERALDQLGAAIDVEAPVGSLPVASRGVVAIARALALGARLLVLDEPTATLQKQEVERLLATLRRLADSGVASLLITHRVDDVMAVCDRITVLRGGRTAATAAVAGLSRDRIVETIMGGAADAIPDTEPPREAPEVLVLERALAEFVGPVSMRLQAGEIVAVTGFADAGHLPLADAVFGVAPFIAGSMTLDGKPFAPRTPREAIARGIGAVPADRAGAGAALELSLLENLFMNPSRTWHGLSRAVHEHNRARDLLERFDVRPPDPDRQFVTLSGGNQQKVLLAKWLDADPRLLVLSEPTAAVDVRARTEIYRHLKESCARRGTAVLLASSDFEEVAELAHRAVVLHRGRVVTELSGDGLTVAAITQAAYGRSG